MDLTSFKNDVDAGSYDQDIHEMIKILEGRAKTVRIGRTKSDFDIGDKVRFNSSTGTRYMVGATGTIVSKKQKKLVVRLDSPVGRFARYNPSTKAYDPADVTCPVSILDPA